MKKESFLVSMLKLIMAVVLIVGIGAVLGILVYSETIPKNKTVNNILGEWKVCSQNSDCVGIRLGCACYIEDAINKNYLNDWTNILREKCGSDKCMMDLGLRFPSDDTINKAVCENNRCEIRQEKDETADWKTYRNSKANFIFKYPDDWEIIADYFYETPAGYIASTPTVILQKIGNNISNNEITINVKQFSCQENIGKCVDLYGRNIEAYVGTHSENKEVLQIFDKILDTFISTEEDETVDWKTYCNEEYGFEMKYPENVLVNDGDNKSDKVNLHILTEKIDNLGDLQFGGFDRESALEDRDAIEKGDPSAHFNWGMADSYKIINIPGALSKEFVILQEFEVCNVQFTKKVFIYKNDYRIRLIWQLSGEEVKKIIENNPDYFVLDAVNCGNYKIWKDSKGFYENLMAGKTDSVSQKWISDFDQILSTFKFIEKDEKLDWLHSDSPYFSSLVSPDGQKVIWTENKYQANKTNSKLILADIDGQNKKVLLEKYFDGEKHFSLIKWSNSNEDIYFSEEEGGIGGYIIFGGPGDLSKLNIYTSELEYLLDQKVGDISPNEEFIAYFPVIDGNPKLAIRNMKTNKENITEIPINEEFKGGGNARFSPDNKHLVYNIAHWDPSDEYFRTIVIDSTGENQKVIIDDFQKAYIVKNWVSNDKILLNGPNGIDYVINIDGDNLREK